MGVVGGCTSAQQLLIYINSSFFYLEEVGESSSRYE